MWLFYVVVTKASFCISVSVVWHWKQPFFCFMKQNHPLFALSEILTDCQILIYSR